VSEPPDPPVADAAGARPLLDLGRPRNVGELLEATFRIFGANAGVLYTLTFLVLAPALFAVDGVWGGGLRDGIEAESSVLQGVVSQLLNGFVLTSLVTGIHVVVVQRLAGGEPVAMVAALRDAAGRLWVLFLVAVLYSAGIVGGLVLLIVPGVWLSVVWYFGAQVAVAEERPVWESLRRSREVVSGQWWRTCGLLVLSSVVFGAIVGPLLSAVVLFDDGVGYVATSILYQTLLTSISALFGTLLFFDLRARADARTDAQLYRAGPLDDYGGFLPPTPPVPEPAG